MIFYTSKKSIYFTVSFLSFLLVLTAYGKTPQRDYFIMPEGITSEDYLEGKIIFKVKEEISHTIKGDKIESGEFELALKKIEARYVRKMFPNHLPPSKSYHISGQPYSDLSRIFQTDLQDGNSLEKAINELYQTGLVEYAQPWYIPKPLYQPDDPFIESQYYLSNIKAYEAWEIEQGDTNIVIAITDTGIDLLHPDLVNSIAYNYDDPLNGEDTDNDGYADNFQGWDIAENNNNPQYDVNAHGVHVAGIAGASADNGTGMAGVGFNSRILPIKISDSDGRLVRAYEGIVYAADKGAQVINCSWGGAMSTGQFGQDIINYAVLNKDAIVIAAAGNSNNQIRIFPASYINALSVAATNIHDHRWEGSSYGKLIDLSAPGAGIFSTWPNGSYISSNGTSMAAPVVAGAAALLRAHFPEYNALQIAAQLKVTTDLIDTIPENEPYSGQMGTGRLNIYRALTETHHPYLLFTGLEQSMEYYQLFNPGESFELGAEFLNLLATSENMSARLSTQSDYIEILQDQAIMGQVFHNQLTNNFSNPFIIKLLENIPASHEATFTISFFNELGVYAGEQNFNMTFNLDYVDFETEILSTTINSRGNIGYNYPNFNQGVGFLYSGTNQNRTLLNVAGLVAGVSTSAVVDNIYGPMENSFTNSFGSVENARMVANPDLGNIMIKGIFNDSVANEKKIGLKINYRIYGYTAAPSNKFIILEYDIINTSEESKPGFYAGFYADWVIQDVRNHRAAFDPENNMGYAFSANGGSFTGVSLLSHSQIRHYAFDNQGFGGSLKIKDGFTSFEKYTAMKSSRENAGFFDIDNDISSLISTGPFNLQSQDTLKVAFAVIAGDHLNDLQNSAQMASLFYNGDFTSTQPIPDTFFSNIKSFPSPFTDKLTARFYQQTKGKSEIFVFDISGRQIYHHPYMNAMPGEINHIINTSDWESGTYIIQIITPHYSHSIKAIK